MLLSINIFMGLFMIGIGLYIHGSKRYDLIAGYNAFTPEQKEKINIEK